MAEVKNNNDNDETIRSVQKRTYEGDTSESEPSSKLVKMPQKKHYRQRAHVNPLSFNSFDSHYRPTDSDSMPWSEHFGSSFNGDKSLVKNLDVGCGYGGLLFKLSKVFPDDFSVGMEIREKVSRFVKDKITAMRHNEPGSWENICCIRTNAMQFLPHFFAKGQLERMFFLYPDPHFKKSKIKWRIISIPLISQYAYLMKEGGLLYTVTDVLQYHEWILENFAATKLFTKVDEEELKDDPIFSFTFDSSEEGQKVTRNEGDKYHAVYRRTSAESKFEPNLTNAKDDLDNAEEDNADGADEDHV